MFNINFMDHDRSRQSMRYGTRYDLESHIGSLWPSDCNIHRERTSTPHHNVCIHQEDSLDLFPQDCFDNLFLTRSQTTSKRPLSKAKKHLFSNFIRKSGKDVTAEIINTTQSSTKVSSSGPRETPVKQDSKDPKAEGIKIGAEFQPYNPYEGESPSMQTSQTSKLQRKRLAQAPDAAKLGERTQSVPEKAHFLFGSRKKKARYRGHTSLSHVKDPIAERNNKGEEVEFDYLFEREKPSRKAHQNLQQRGICLAQKEVPGSHPPDEKSVLSQFLKKIPRQRTPSPNGLYVMLEHGGYSQPISAEHARLPSRHDYKNQPFFTESQLISQRPHSKQKKHRTFCLNSGKDKSVEKLITAQSSAKVSCAGLGDASVKDESEDLQAQGTTFVQKISANVHSLPESSPSQTPPPSQVQREHLAQEAVPGSHLPVEASLGELSQSVPEKGMLPKEILNMDSRSIELYNTALQEGEDNNHNIRLMIVGHYGVGKTTLKKRLFKENVDIKERKSTDGIDVGRCKILKNKKWLTGRNQTVGDRKALFHRIAKLMCNRNNENERSQYSQQRQRALSNNARTTKVGYIKKKIGKVTTRKMNKTLSLLKAESSKTKACSQNELDTRTADEGNVKYSPVEAWTCDDLRANTNQTDTAGKQDDDSVRKKKHLQEFVNEVQHDFSMEDDVHSDLSLWDFAGQNIYYATHQAFLSLRAIYLLVLDVSRHIDDAVQDDVWHFDCQGEQECKVTEFIEFWLNSIHEFCSLPGGNGPPVILVGTFIDKLKQKSDVSRCFYNLRSSFVGKVTNCHLTEKQFYVDNTVEQDDNIEALRQYVVKIASEQSYWGERIPAKWITLEERLIRLKEEQNVKVLQMERLRAENRLLPVPIESEAELELFLKFHHESGTILYFGEEDLKDEILLDPKWLIDAFKSLITAAMFCICSTEIQEKWHKFDRTAVLTQDLIALIWSKEENREYWNHKEMTLKFMEKLGFVAKPKRCADVSLKFEEYYFVPCMLKDPPPAKIIRWNDSEHMKSTSKLCLTNAEEADKRFLPSTAFNRLISASINQWPLSRQNGKYMIFCGGAVFQLEDNHYLYIFLYKHVLQIWVSRLSTEGQYPLVSLCRKTQNQVKKILDENVRMRRSLLSFVKCPQSSLYSNENMVVIQEDRSIQNREIPCFCHDNEHVVSYVDMVKYWLPGDRLPRFGHALSLDLESKPTEKDFSRISRRIGKEFKQVAFELGLSQPEIDHICIDNKTAADKITAVLRKWSKRMDEQATYGELIKALQEAGVDVASVFRS